MNSTNRVKNGNGQDKMNHINRNKSAKTFAPQKSLAAATDAVEDIEQSKNMATPNAADDPVFAKYGPPFITSKKGVVHMNQRAVAEKCATEHVIRFEPRRNAFERFDQKIGLWVATHESAIRRMLGDQLLALGKEWKQEEFVQLNTTGHFNALCKMIQPYQANVASESTAGLIHVSNGVLDLQGATPKLLPHHPKYPFRSSPQIKYDPKAKCPKFLDNFLKVALTPEDIDLVQKYCGSMLLGPNMSHGILIIRGTAGGGKSTLVSIVEQIIGEDSVAHLRTKHISGRFETSAFIGKRVLVGKDVPGDCLTESGAHLLKSLVGGDLLQAEIKYNPNKPTIRGDYHVIIASNNRLRINLDGDEEAWGRRLLLVDFEKQKPSKPIADFAQKLVAEEGSGILNWLIKGAAAYREDMAKRGCIYRTEKHEQRVANLLHDSDSVLSFFEQRVIAQEKADLSSEELLLGYYTHCTKHNWKPVSGHRFQVQLPDLICQRYQVCRRNDITRDGKAVRGYKDLALTKLALN